MKRNKVTAAPSADFDMYAGAYDDVMRSALGVIGGESTYYLSQKTWILRKLLPDLNSPVILDFGSGIGGAVPFLKRAFSPSALLCVDQSIDSLKEVSKNYPDVQTLQLSEVVNRSIDVVFVANVFHHIPKNLRLNVLTDLGLKLKKGGHLAIFEHNPWNPMTRKVVSSCEFDVGVDLLTSNELLALLMSSTGLMPVAAGYCTFVPEPLRRLRKFDWLLRKFPFGAQHYLIAKIVN